MSDIAYYGNDLYILNANNHSEQLEIIYTKRHQYPQGQTRKVTQSASLAGRISSGSISVNYRKCGKPGCRCAQKGAKGHGPQYLWNATIAGKSVAKNLNIGPEAEKYLQETEQYKTYVRLCEEYVAVNEQLCEAHPVRHLESEKDLEALKKKLQKQLLKKRAAR